MKGFKVERRDMKAFIRCMKACMYDFYRRHFQKFSMFPDDQKYSAKYLFQNKRPRISNTQP